MSQQKMDPNKGYILAEDLAEIISCEFLPDSIEKPNLNEEDFGDNLDAYFNEYKKHIEKKVKEKHLEQYISIKKLENIEIHPVKEFGVAFWLKYKVIISDLTIDNVEEDTEIFLDPIYVDEYVSVPVDSESEQKDNEVLFEFKGNNFIGSRDKTIIVILGDCTNFSFIRNYFEGPDFDVHAKNTGGTLLEFHGNTFKNSYVAIGVDVSKDYVLGNWRLKEAATSQIPAVNKLEYLINENIQEDTFKAAVHDHNKIKVTPEQIEKIASKSIVKMANNKCSRLGVSGDGDFHLAGKNFIELFTVGDSMNTGPSFSPTIHWGAHQKLDKNGEYFLAHKKIFTILKQRAIANNDTMQEIILQREIAKCDHAIVKSEKILFPWKDLKKRKFSEIWDDFMAWLGILQDKAIFWFSKWISNYGTSWIMPFIWLASLNLIIAVLALNISSDQDFKMWVAFWKLFNPTNSLADMPWSKIDVNGLISFLFISQKVVLAFTLYEMIKIFRRFGRR